MTTQPPDDDPFKKQPPDGSGGGSPYDTPPGGPGGPSGPGGPGEGGGPYGAPPPPYGGDAYGGGYGGADPLAGMPPLADSGRRVLARLIDMVLVGVVVWLISLSFGGITFDTDPEQVEFSESFGHSLLAAVLYTGYDTVLIAQSGQTLGKKWLGLRVANLDNGATPSMQTSLLRAGVLWLPFAFCCACVWTAICGGWSFFDKPYKQGLHDKAAKTVAVTVT
ncbi:RDD family protein [Streptomyces sp. NPDC002851]